MIASNCNIGSFGVVYKSRDKGEILDKNINESDNG